MHTIVRVTANGRCRRGTYSDASAAAFGIAPPSPKPARNRRTPSIMTPLTVAMASVTAAKDTTLPRSAARQQPILHQGRHGVAEQLVVNAVQDNRERRPQDEQLLIAAPLAFVDDGANIHRFHTSPFRLVLVTRCDLLFCRFTAQRVNRKQRHQSRQRV